MTKPKYKISVITPSYNQGHFIEETITSVLNQNYPNLEYIIMDGGSTDKTVDIIRKYEDSITYWVSQPDKGPADALQKGLAMATGDILCYLNSDDCFLNGTLHKVAHYFGQLPDVDVIHGNGYISNAHSQIVSSLYSNRWSLNLYLHGYAMIVQQSTFFRRAAYERTSGVNINNKTCWDGEMWVDMSLTGSRFHRVPNHLSVFRIHKHSITGSQTNTEAYRQDEERIRRKCGVAKRNRTYLLFAFANDPILYIKRLIAKWRRD